MKKYLVALDQGTTSSRAIVFDRSQQIVASAQKEFPQLYPQAGWVEHDPLELYSSQYGVMMEAITRGGIDPAEIAAIGITSARRPSSGKRPRAAPFTLPSSGSAAARPPCATGCAPTG